MSLWAISLPSLACSSRKRICRSSIAPKTLMGTLTAPNATAPFQIDRGATRLFLQARRAPRHVAGVVDHGVDPARAGLTPRDRVEAHARDDHVDVGGVGVEGHPPAPARLAPAPERAGGQRRVEQA